MRKGWHFISGIAYMCILLGVVGLVVGLVTGSSLTALEHHGSLGQYVERLATNWDIIREWCASFAARFWF